MTAHRGCDHPADPAEAVAVRRAGRPKPPAAAGSRRPSSRRAGASGSRAPRMPRIDELPLPAQNEIRAQRGEPTSTGASGKAADVAAAAAGLGRARPSRRGRAQEPPAHRVPAVRPVPRAAAQLPPRAGTAPTPESEAPEPVSEYAKRPDARRASICTAGRPLCITRRRTTSSKSRLSCAGRPTELQLCCTRSGPAHRRRADFAFRVIGKPSDLNKRFIA